jgi:hypothetical protein
MAFDNSHGLDMSVTSRGASNYFGPTLVRHTDEDSSELKINGCTDRVLFTGEDGPVEHIILTSRNARILALNRSVFGIHDMLRTVL